MYDWTCAYPAGLQEKRAKKWASSSWRNLRPFDLFSKPAAAAEKSPSTASATESVGNIFL